MLKFSVLVLALLASASNSRAQMQIADRAPSSTPAQYLSLPAGTQGFLADDFQVGAANEDWVIDHIRLWVVPDPKATSARAPGELFTKITLLGGIAPEMGAPGEVTCDCHNLPKLRTASFAPGGASFNTASETLKLTRQTDGPELWQMDFKDLKWSVPGAKPIQFGLLAQPRTGEESSTLFYAASAPDGGQHLRVFSAAGAFKGPLGAQDAGRVNVQVWGHLLAKVSISAAGPDLTVILRGQPAMPASQVNPATLHFGPKGVAPENVHVIDTRHDGQGDVVMTIRLADAGLTSQSVNACLDGQRLDGAPFEGCDLLPH